VGANAGAAALDLVRPTEGAGTVRHGQAGDGELDAVDGGGGHRVRCGVLWNCRRWRGRRQPAPQGSGGDLLQVAVAAGVADQAPQGEAQQVGRGDHLCQVSSEGGGGIEPVGTVGAALEDDLNSGAVDLNVGDGAALLGGEGAEDGGGSGGHEVRLRVLENCTMERGRPWAPPWGSEVVCHVPANHLQVRAEAGAGLPCLLGGGCHVGHDLMALAAGVPTAEQELVLLLLSEHVFPVLLGGDVRFVDLGVVGEGGHRVWCGLLWNSTGWEGRGQPAPGGSDACHGSSDAVPLADRGGHDEPQVALPIIGAGGIQNACLLKVDHEGVDGALMAAGVHAHGANQVAAGHRAVVDQAGADRGADDGGQHLSGVRCA
jgi:hypothetical protein